MTIKNTVIEAIKKINPDANVSVGNDSIDEITWVEGTTPISKTDIQNKMNELAVEAAAVKYKTDRTTNGSTTYASFGDQLDMLYADMLAGKLDTTGTWATHIKAVKDANPKPS